MSTGDGATPGATPARGTTPASEASPAAGTAPGIGTASGGGTAGGTGGATTATLGRRTPGLVPVTETMRTTERHPPEPPPAADDGDTSQKGAPAGVGRATWAFWRLFGSELRLTFRRPRNLAMLAVLALVPVVLGVGLRIAGGSGGPGDEMSGIIADVAGNSLMLTFLSFSFLVLLLMPVAVSVVAGDSIAGEAGGGTLRYLLAAPAGRTRLLAVKYLNAVVYGYAVTAVVALSALVTGMVLFPAGDVTLLSGTTISFVEGLARIAVAVGYVGAGMGALAAIALAISTFTEVPIGAIAGTLVLVIICQVLRAIPDLDVIAPYLLPTWFTNFDAVLRSPIDTGALGEGLLAFGAYIALFGSIAWARFSGKDITS